MATCQERAGFLFSHECREAATTRCETCDKEVCQAHGRLSAGALVCVSCARGAQRSDRRRHQDRHYDHHDPYFYGSYYYGYGHYGHGYWGSSHLGRDDFTEADATSLSDSEGESFENDVGGS